MKKLWILTIGLGFLLCSPTHAISADDDYTLEKGGKFHKSGDYLFAAKVFKKVYELSNNTNIKAEALYRFILAGRDAAKAFTTRYAFWEQNALKLQGGPNYEEELEKWMNEWEKEFKVIMDEDFNRFKEIGLEFGLNHYSPVYNLDDLTHLQKLSKEFPLTKWGETATFETVEYGTPEKVLINCQEFSKSYPNSRFNYDINIIKAQAFNDLWNFTVDEEVKAYCPECTPKEMANKQEFIRSEAIKLFELAKKHKDRLVYKKWDADKEETLEELRLKIHTLRYYYYSD